MNTKANAFSLIVLLVLFVSPSACSELPDTYSAEAIEAWVIDADTKKPIEGVIVVAHWQLFYSTVGGRVPAGQLEVMETVTGQDGKFFFPAWGPKKVPKYKPKEGDTWVAHIPLFVPDSHLDDRDPALILFKPGYKYRGLQNPARSYTDHSPVRRSMWNGKQIELRSLKGVDIQTQYKNLLTFSKEVDSFATWHVDPCQWTKLPIAIHEMLRERKKLEAQGARAVMDRTLDRQLLEGEPYFIKQCGSTAQTFIDGLKK